VDHDDQSVMTTASEVQTNLTSLKHLYLAKRTHLIDRLVKHQTNIEEYFEAYYETLDEQRKLILADEYELRA